MKKIFTLLVAVAMMATVLTGCGGGSKSELKFTTGGDQGTYYGFGSVLAGQVSSSTDTTVTARMDGVVASIEIKEGDAVKGGQLLMTIK